MQARRIIIKHWLNRIDRNYLIFLVATGLIGIGQSVDGSTLTNYLKDNLGMMILQRSALEIPRELPGLLVVVTIGLLSFLGDVRISVVANILTAVGMFCLGIIPPQYEYVVLVIFIYSMGMHMYMPMANSIGMSFATAGEMGRKLGRMNAVNTFTLVLSSAVLWALFKYIHISFTTSFTIGAAAFLLAGLCFLFVEPTQAGRQTKRFIFKKEYRLYYWLCMLFGARKQIFITFGPWVLVEIFHQHVATMTMLFFIVSVSGIFVKPWIGHMIDNLGEKTILCGEAVAFFFVCLGYAFAADIFRPATALIAICTCYVLDQSMSSVSMARATYMKKLAISPEDVSASLSMGTSLDHMITMVLPVVGGLVWYNNGANGYKYVFIGGAVIAVLNFVSAQFINLNAKKGTAAINAAVPRE